MGGDTEQNLVAVLIILILPLVSGDVVLLVLHEPALQVYVGFLNRLVTCQTTSQMSLSESNFPSVLHHTVLLQDWTRNRGICHYHQLQEWRFPTHCAFYREGKNMFTWYGVSHSQPFKSLVGETFTFIEHSPEPPLQPLSQCLAQAQDQGSGADFVVFWTPIMLVGLV